MFNDYTHNACIAKPRQDTNFFHNLTQLKTSGLYWRNLSREDAENILQNKSFGDFLVRDSRMNTCFFTLSIKCKPKVVHIRTIYSKGQFSIEGEFYGQEPKFDNCLSMLEYYMHFSKSGSFLTMLSSKNRKCHVQLLRALRTSCPTLKHLCRISINSQIEKGQLPANVEKLPDDVKSYLEAYPYPI